MIQFVRHLSIIIILALILSGSGVFAENQKLQLEINLDKETFLLQEAIWLDVIFTNISSDTIRFWGLFPPHSSHQNGCDVDMRYVRSDGQEVPLDISGPDSTNYSKINTIYLMRLLIYYSSINVDVILYDSINAHITDTTGNHLLHWPGHSDHFHVRITDPDGTSN